MNNMRNKILMTLALLITAVAGAWAQEEYESFDLSSANTNVNGTHFTITGTSGMNNYGLFLSGESVTVTSLNGENITRVEFIIGLGKSKAENITGTPGTNSCTNGNENGSITDINATSVTLSTENTGITSVSIKQITVYYCNSEPAAPTVEPVEGKTNEWTFTMPAYDVEIAPEYAPVAKWATEGDAVLAPTAVEGIFAGTEDAIVNAGTVVEGQGTAMYFATTDAEMTAEKAAAADGWLSTLPTAAGYDGAQTVYVWYYIKGADTPDGQTATAENTFNDLEICATPIEVTLLSNKFDIQFNAANANTIEAGKATVKVGETAAEVKEGKLTGVKMGSKVTITAKDGYKFRKVEATKGISTLKSVKIGNYTVYYAEGETWYQAFWRDENKNCGLMTSVGRVFTYGNKSLRDSDGDVYADAVINPSKGYYIAD